MKILAHSVVPTNPLPYLHLGYISASAEQRTHSDDFLRTIWAYELCCFVVLIVAVQFFLKSTRQRIRVGLVLALAAVIVGSIPLILPDRYAHPVEATYDHMESMISPIVYSMNQSKKLPVTTGALKCGQQYKARDGWGQYFRIEQQTVGSLTGYILVSAGPDGQFGTVDDISNLNGPKRRAHGIFVMTKQKDGTVRATYHIAGPDGKFGTKDDR